MKSKMKGVLAVGLVLVLLVSLTVGFVAPAAADPGVLKWSKMPFPAPGFNGSYFRDTGITGIGPIAKAIDGSLFAYAAGLDNIFKSTDGGRTWKATKYAAAGGGAVVAVVPSSKDASIVYVAEVGKVWKSTDVFTKTKWSDIATPSLTAVLSGDITCMDVGYKAGNPFVFVGTSTGGWAGDVYYINEAAYGAGWQPLGLNVGSGSDDVYAVAVDPGFDANSQIEVVCTDGIDTFVTNNAGSFGAWFDDVALKAGSPPLPAGVSFDIVGASRICFPDDFDASTNYDLFVGVVDNSLTIGAGDVYEVIPGIAYDLNVAAIDSSAFADGIISLDLVGNAGSTLMLAGQYTAADVYYTTDGGSSWKAASNGGNKVPSGNGPTLVVMSDDFATSSKAWAATATVVGDSPAAFSLTRDGGATWNGISLIATDIGAVNDITFSGSNLRFMAASPTGAAATNDTLWKYDGTNWELVKNEVAIDLTQVSPKYATDTTVFCGDSATATIYKSTNGGASFRALVNAPGAPITGWVVVSPTLLIASDGASIYKTKDAGRTGWSTITTSFGAISFAMSPAYDTDTTLLAGSFGTGKVYKSTDAGATWSNIDSTFGGDGDVYVAFDPGYATNGTFYAASTVSAALDVERYDPTNKWASITPTWPVTTGGATGIACSADGTLYVSDATAVDMFRTLAPTAPSAAKCEWEQVTKNVSSETNLASLALTPSNVLWGIDGTTGDVVWTYEDTLAVPVVLLSPSDKASSGRTGTASLTWNALTGADEYEVKCNTRSDFLGAAQEISPAGTVDTNAATVIKLSGGAAYYWKVRAAAGQPIKSRWSKVWSFTTAMTQAEWNPGTGPVAAAPAPGATDVPIRPTFAWNASDFATGYEFELSKAPGTTAGGFFVDALIGMTGTNALVNTSWQCDRDLDYSTTYYWHVRAISATSQSQWLTGVFTTMAKPVPPPPPVEVKIPPAPAPITPAWIWAIVIIGAILVIAVIVLIVTTRRVP